MAGHLRIDAFRDVRIDARPYQPLATDRRRTLHVAIDLRIVDAPGMETTGAGRYALETARSLRLARPGWRLSLFCNRPELLEGWDATVRSTRLPTQHALGRILWLHTASAAALVRAKPDIWFSPSFVLPRWWPGAAVVTIHDLTFMLLRRRYRGSANAWYATAATRWSARRADRVLCGSHETRRLLEAHLGVAASKVEVIPYGVAEPFFGPPRAHSQAHDAGTLPYLLFVGTWEARKGLATLYEAILRVNDGQRRVRLVLAGQPGWGTEALIAEMRANHDVAFVQKPNDEELADLYRNALALAYPSEMEGFGLPVAEAMACGCAVIASDLPSIREFAGDTPLYIPAGDVQQLASHVQALLSGNAQVEQRRRAGRDAASGLRWSAVGERTAATIEQAVQGHARASART